MNPMFAAALGSIVRWALAIGAGYLVSHRVWAQSDATMYVEAATLALVALVWSQYQKWQERRKLVTALMLAKTSESSLKSHIAIAPAPSVTTPEHAVPVPDLHPGSN